MKNNKRLIAKIMNGDSVVMTLDKNLLSAEFGALDRGNLTDVTNWGIYANRGSISFIDKTGFFNNKNIHSAELLGYKVKFYLYYNNKETLISTFNIEDASLIEDTMEVTIELVSNLVALETEDIESTVYPFYEKSIADILEDVNSVIPKSKIYLGKDTKNISSVFIGCPYITKESIWNVMTKICQASMSRIVETEDGLLEITGSFPKRTPIILKPQNIIGVFNNCFFSEKNLSIETTKRKKIIDRAPEETSKYFRLRSGEKAGEIFADGIEVSLGEIQKESYSLGDYKEYQNAYGNINLSTPYTIFNVSNAMFVSIERANDGSSTKTEFVYDKDFGDSPIIVNEKDIFSEFNFIYMENYFENYILKGFRFVEDGYCAFPISGFRDEGTDTLQIISSEKQKINKIDSNDLIQDISFYKKDDGTSLSLGQYILDEVSSRYSNGIECFEIECLFNNYYDENGNKVFDTEDLSKHFERYDIIIPYVQKQGRTVPLRVDENGNPKKFRIIGISYSYDGLLKQKLSVQEERYDVD